MVLPPNLLLTYRKEFESSDITIQELCKKYHVTLKELKGYSTWKKEQPKPQPKQPPAAPVPIANIEIPQLPKKLPITPTDTSVKDDIEKFKKLAIANALRFIEEDIAFASVKDFKDIVAIVDSIDKSYKDIKDTGPTIQVLVQNIFERFNDDV